MLEKIKTKILFLLVMPLLIFAADDFRVKLPIDKKITSVEYAFKVVLEAILDLAVPIIVLAIMYVGFLFVKAQGNDSELAKAKEALMYVLIGTVIVIASNAIYAILYASHKTAFLITVSPWS